MKNILYGMHMEIGVAEYRPTDKPAYRSLVDENTAKQMDPSFAGKPVYVHHYDGDVDFQSMDKVKEEADGYVVESFYNPVDGKHWAKFIIITERGMEAVQKKWKLSNAFFTTKSAGGGKWHGVDYNYRVVEANYEHLAIVPDPRYEASVIMTPEEFKQYCEQKENDLKKFKNSEESEKGDKGMKFEFFKKSKVENSADFETMSVKLPKSGVSVELTKLINEADKAEVEKKENADKPKYAEVEHLVKVGDEELTVNELVSKYQENCKKMNESEEEKEENESDEEEKKENESEEDEKKENEEEKPEKKENSKSKENFNKINNAADFNKAQDAVYVETVSDQVARGKERY